MLEYKKECECTDEEAHILGSCFNLCKKDFRICYFCYMNHVIPETDNDPLTGTDENDLSRKYETRQEKLKHEGT